MVIPLLTVAAYFDDRRARNRAVRILSRCYRSIIAGQHQSDTQTVNTTFPDQEPDDKHITLQKPERTRKDLPSKASGTNDSDLPEAHKDLPSGALSSNNSDLPQAHKDLPSKTSGATNCDLTKILDLIETCSDYITRYSPRLLSQALQRHCLSLKSTLTPHSERSYQIRK